MKKPKRAMKLKDAAALIRAGFCADRWELFLPGCDSTPIVVSYWPCSGIPHHYHEATSRWKRTRWRASTTYEWLTDNDVARELARIDLPLSIYTQWYWKIDLHNLLTSSRSGATGTRSGRSGSSRT